MRNNHATYVRSYINTPPRTHKHTQAHAHAHAHAPHAHTSITQVREIAISRG